MPDAAHLGAFFAATITIALIPGPGILYVLARSMGGGRAVGLRSSYGTGVGGLLHVVAAAAGLSAIIAAPQFCQPENGPLALQVVVLGTVAVALNTLVDVVVAFGAGRISDRLRPRPSLWRRQQIATGSFLVGLGVYAAASGHRPARP